MASLGNARTPIRARRPNSPSIVPSAAWAKAQRPSTSIDEERSSSTSTSGVTQPPPQAASPGSPAQARPSPHGIRRDGAVQPGAAATGPQIR